MWTIFLAIVIVILLTVTLCYSSDFLSPASAVCESFALAFLCAIASSNAQGWRFELHFASTIILTFGVLFFLIGCFIGKKSLPKGIQNEDFDYLNCSMRTLIIMFLIQLILLIVYIYYYKQTVAQFSGMDWYSMMRLRRSITAYGEGLDVNIPSLVSRSVQAAKAISYVNLYILMHNMAARNVLKKKNPNSSFLKKLISLLCVAIYIPYPILQSGRFEIMALIIAGMMMWYICYSRFSSAIGKKQKNMKNAFFKVLGIVVLSAVLMSLLTTVVGRMASDSLFSEAFNYLGRCIQAFDESIQTGSIYSVKRKSETFLSLFNFLSRLGVTNSTDKLYLEFISQDGIFLGNTYTAFRRYYRDFDILGVVLLPFVQGLIMTRVYFKAERRETSRSHYPIMVYATIAHSVFLYCYEDYFYTLFLGVNYFIYFILLYFFYAYATGRIHFTKNLKIVIKKGI